jgi:hypothetical protein
MEDFTDFERIIIAVMAKAMTDSLSGDEIAKVSTNMEIAFMGLLKPPKTEEEKRELAKLLLLSQELDSFLRKANQRFSTTEQETTSKSSIPTSPTEKTADC